METRWPENALTGLLLQPIHVTNWKLLSFDSHLGRVQVALPGIAFGPESHAVRLCSPKFQWPQAYYECGSERYQNALGQWSKTKNILVSKEDTTERSKVQTHDQTDRWPD